MIDNIIIVVVLLVIVGAAAGYIIKAKRSGAKCIGCSVGEGGCARKRGGDSSSPCGCGCGGSSETGAACGCHTDTPPT